MTFFENMFDSVAQILGYGSEETLCDCRCGQLHQHMKYECILKKYWEKTDNNDGTWEDWVEIPCSIVACNCRWGTLVYTVQGVSATIRCLDCEHEDIYQIHKKECREHRIEGEFIFCDLGPDVFC